MKVNELILKLSSFDPKLDVTISDGYDLVFYSTEDLDFVCDDKVLDIGIGSCKIEEE